MAAESSSSSARAPTASTHATCSSCRSWRAANRSTSARSGRLELDAKGDRYLVLERGQRNDVDLQSNEKTMSSFERYRVLADERRVRDVESRPPKAMDTVDLVREPTARNLGELVWRFGLLFGSANLLLLGIALSATNPRRASNWNLLFALLAFFVYYNLINLSQAWVASGRIGMGAALAGLHVGAFGLALALLWWRDHCGRDPAVADAAAQDDRHEDRSAGCCTATSSRRCCSSRLAFLSLFFFIDLVDELDGVGRRGRNASGTRCWQRGATNCRAMCTSCLRRSPC